jgi:nitrite reductase/ring-hydroxylating ferredoxin subunit
MAWKEALIATELPEGAKQVVTLGDADVLLIRHKGKVYATAARCPHMRAKLVRGTVTQEGALICPLHHSAFDLATGNVLEWSPWPPAVGRLLGAISREKALTIYPVRERAGVIEVAASEGSTS